MTRQPIATNGAASQVSLRGLPAPAPGAFEPTEPPLTAAEREAARAKAVARWRLLWKHRTWLLRWAAAGISLSAALAFLLPNQYVSTTRLMPPDSVSPGAAMLAAAAGGRSQSGGLAGIAGDLLGLKSTGALFVGILQSRTIEDDLISRFELRKIYGRKRWEDAREKLAKNTKVSEDSKSGIITVQVTDKRPERAAAMAAEYTEELDRVVTSLNTGAAHRERVFLEERLGQVQQALESAEENFSQFASKNTAIDIEAQGKAMIEAAASIESQLVATETELESLRQIYSDSNVRVRATEARAQELRRQLLRLDGKSEGQPDGQLDGQPNVPSDGRLVGRPDSPRIDNASTEDSLYPSIRKLPLLGVSYADLYRTTKVQEALYEALTQEYELAKVEEAKETPSVKVIDPPEIPEKKSGPPRLLIALGGTILFVLGAAALVFASAWWAELAVDDPGKALAMEVFESVRPRWPRRAAHRDAGQTNGSGPETAR